MALWSISLLLISISYLTYHHPPATWTILPQWMRPAKRQLPAGAQKSEPLEKDTEDTEDTEQKQWHSDRALDTADNPDHRTGGPLQISGEKEKEEDEDEDEEEEGDGDKTPLAMSASSTTVTSLPVPLFTLDSSQTEEDGQGQKENREEKQEQTQAPQDQDQDQDRDEEQDERDNLPPPMFPAANSAQRASAPLPPPSPFASPSASPSPSFTLSTTPSTLMPPPSAKPPSSLMGPPPPRPSSSSLMPPPRGPPIRAQPSTASSLRVPSTGPVPNRGPPASSAAQARLGSGLAPSRIDTPNSRNKVQLTPGHSPLDWATLSRSKSLSGVPHFMRVTPSMLKHHNGRKDRDTGQKKDAWSVYLGKVYNITPYLPFHPGGQGELLRAAGKDGTALFNDVHPWVNWEGMMSSCLVGIMVSETEENSGLDSLD